MLVGCLWQNDNLVTVSLGGTFNVFSASNPDKEPVSFAGHLKTASALALFPQSNPRTMLSTSYDGVILKWIQGVGYGGRLIRKNNTQIKCFVATEEELITSGYDNKVRTKKTQGGPYAYLLTVIRIYVRINEICIGLRTK